MKDTDLPDYSRMPRAATAGPKRSGMNSGLSAANKQKLDNLSARGGAPSSRASSRAASQYSIVPSSTVTRLPKTDKLKMMHIGNDILLFRKRVIQSLSTSRI
jgi:hypothetical protein